MGTKATFLGLSALSLVVSLITVFIHAHVQVGCPLSQVTSVVNCDTVIQSSGGAPLGVPLGAWGMVWVISGLLVRMRWADTSLAWIWAILGVVGVAYALGTELAVRHLCAWCTLDQAVAVALVVLTLAPVPRRG